MNLKKIKMSCVPLFHRGHEEQGTLTSLHKSSSSSFLLLLLFLLVLKINAAAKMKTEEKMDQTLFLKFLNVTLCLSVNFREL